MAPKSFMNVVIAHASVVRRLGAAPMGPFAVRWRFAMTEKEWREEVDRALGGAGLPWRLFAAWIDANRITCCAEVTHTSNGKMRTVRLSQTQFDTVAARRVEISRQLGGGG